MIFLKLLKYSEDQKMDLLRSLKSSSCTGRNGHALGVSRTVAQIHALLYLSERALHAEEIADTFRWRAQCQHQSEGVAGLGPGQGGPRDGRSPRSLHVATGHYELFRVIVEERKRREFDRR